MTRKEPLFSRQKEAEKRASALRENLKRRKDAARAGNESGQNTKTEKP